MAWKNHSKYSLLVIRCFYFFYFVCFSCYCGLLLPCVWLQSWAGKQSTIVLLHDPLSVCMCVCLCFCKSLVILPNLVIADRWCFFHLMSKMLSFPFYFFHTTPRLSSFFSNLHSFWFGKGKHVPPLSSLGEAKNMWYLFTPMNYNQSSFSFLNVE